MPKIGQEEYKAILQIYNRPIVYGCGNCNTYNITIALNGNKIDGSLSNLTMTANYGKVAIICVETGDLVNPAKFVRTI